MASRRTDGGGEPAMPGKYADARWLAGRAARPRPTPPISEARRLHLTRARHVRNSISDSGSSMAKISRWVS